MGRSLGEGIDVGFQEYNRNKMLTSQSIAKWEGTVKANPEIAQFLDSSNPNAPEAATKAFAKLHKDGAVGLKDAAVLAQFADSFVSSKKEALAQQQQQSLMQTEDLKRQALTKQIAQQSKDQQALTSALSKFSQAGAITPPMKGPDGQPMPAKASPDFDPRAFMQDYFKNGGSPESIDKIDTVLKSMMTPPKPTAIKIGTVFDVDAKGNPTRRSIDEGSGQYLGAPSPIAQPPRAYPTPEEAGATELAKTVAQETGKADVALLNDVSTAAAQAQDTQARINTARKLYASGAASGWGQDVLNDITGAAVQLGLYPAGKQANKEELQVALSRDALDKARELYKGQGSVSEPERKRLDKIATDIGKTKEANLFAFDVAEELTTQAKDMEMLRRKLYDAGKTPKEIAEQVRRYKVDNPIGVKKKEDSAPALPAGWTVK